MTVALLKGMLHQNESELSSLVRSGPWRREEIHHQRGVCGWGLWGEGEPGCLVPWVTQLLDIWDKLPKDGGCLEFPTPPPTLHPLMLTGCWTGFGCSPQAGRERRGRFGRPRSWAPGGTQVKEQTWIRELPGVPLRGEGSCGGGGAPRDSAGSGATEEGPG